MDEETSAEYEAAQRAYRDATDRLAAVLGKVVAERAADMAGTSVRGIVVLAVEGEGRGTRRRRSSGSSSATVRLHPTSRVRSSSRMR